MATETIVLPGYGIVVDEQDGNTVVIPGYGIVANRAAVAATGGIRNPLSGSNPLKGPIS